MIRVRYSKVHFDKISEAHEQWSREFIKSQ